MEKSSNYQSEQINAFQLSQKQTILEDNTKTQKISKSKPRLWTDAQNKKYCKFLTRQKSVFENAQLRKSRKIFVKMSNFIKSRNKIQCKTHHQKMIQFYASIDGIIEYLTRDQSDLVSYGKMEDITNIQTVQQCSHGLNKKPMQKSNEDYQFLEERDNFSFQQDDLWGVLNQKIWKDKQQQQNQQ